ncbi:MAG: TRAP transporter large permease [Peptococcales bacterium]|jgi:C4-dicarboxylate transporter DctM subunit
MASVLFISFFAGALIGIPMAIALTVSSIIGLFYLGIQGMSLEWTLIAQRYYVSLDNYPLLAIPFFVLAGDLMLDGGISKKLIVFANSLIGRTPGGLAHVNTLSCMFFSAISGSSPATCAAVGGVMIPEMEKEGYHRSFASAVTAAGGCIGIVIPPSIPLVVYGVIAQQSIGELFLAAVIPGVLMGVSLMITNYVISKKRNYISPTVEKISVKFILESFFKAIPALGAPLVVLGGIYFGVFTPTEAAIVAAAYSFLVGLFIYKGFNLKEFPKIVIRAGISSGVIVLLIAGATLFGFILTHQMIPQQIAQFMASTISSPMVYLLMLNLLLLFAGTFLNPSAAIVIIAPIVLPTALAMGIDPVFLGVMIVLNMSIGMITPPVGQDLFVVVRIAKVSFEAVLRDVWPYIIALVTVLLFITYFNGIVTWLPGLAM